MEYLSFAAYTLPAFVENVFDEDSIADVDMPWDASYEQYLAAAETFAVMQPGCTVWRNNPISAGVAEYPDNSSSVISIVDGVWTVYNGDAPDLTVWTGYDDVNVTALGEGLFKGNTSIRTFYPHHCGWFTTIGKEAFAESSLEYVELFDSITEIGEGAFRACVNLETIELPANLTCVGAAAFKDCTALKTVIIHCDPAILPSDAFEGCFAVENVIVDNGEIPAFLFENLPKEISPVVKTAVYDDFVGVWKVDSAAYENGDTVPFDLTITVSADGLASAEGYDQKTYGTAAMEGYSLLISIEGDEISFEKLNNGMLHAMDTDLELWFVLTDEEPVVVLPTPESTPAPEPTAEPTDEPVPETEPAGMTVKSVTGDDAVSCEPTYGKEYVGKFAMASGFRMDTSMLGGRYAIVFNENGTADFTLAGMTVPSLAWTLEQNDTEGIVLVLDYYGTPLRFISMLNKVNVSTLELNYFDAMVIVFEVQ